MPTATITIHPEDIQLVTAHLPALRAIVADEMSTRKKHITADQVSLRMVPVANRLPIAAVEIEVVGHAFVHRLRGLDERARRIATAAGAVLGLQCSCWINLAVVGYAPGSTGRH